MALTPEQQKRLEESLLQIRTQTSPVSSRDYGSALSELDKSIAREKATSRMTEQKDTGITGFFKNLGREIAKPYARVGTSLVNVGESIADLARGDVRGASEALDKTRNVPFVGETEPMFTGKETTGEATKKIIGTGLEIGADVVGTGAAAKVGKATLGGLVREGIKTGVKAGTTTGAMALSGRSLQEDERATDVLLNAALGATGGAILGGTIGGISPVVGKTVRKMLEPVETKVSNTIKTAIDKGIKPYFSGKQTSAQRQKYYDLAEKAFVSIYKRKPKIYDDEIGEAVQKLPETRGEMLDALGKAKQQVFQQYDELAEAAGERGVVFNAQKAIEELQKIASPQNKQYSPEVRGYAGRLIDEVKELQGQSPTVIQERIKELNSSLASFFSGRTDKTKAQVDASVARLLNKELDDEITRALDTPDYRALRNEYSALKSIEKDLARQVNVELRKGTKGFYDITDIFTGQDILFGIATGNPSQLLKGVAGGFIKENIKFLNDPNRYIRKAFKTLDNPPTDIKKLLDEAAYYLKTRGGLSIEDVTKRPGKEGAEQAQRFLADEKLTTKFLSYIDDKLAKNPKAVLSKQEILDFAKRPELKKGEADLLLKKLEEFEPKEGRIYSGVDINEFASDKTNFEILPPSYLPKKINKLWRGEQAMTGLGTGSGAEGFGLYTTTNKKIAKSYADLSENGVLREMPLDSKPSNPLYFRGPSEVQSWVQKVAKKLGMRVSEFNENIGINKIVSDLGYDGVAFNHGSDSGVAFVKFGKSPASSSKLPAQDFADSIRRDLLELKPVKVKDPQYSKITLQRQLDWSADHFQESLKTANKNYEEVIFESPITTNGSSHYPNSKNYFAHARGDEVVEGGKKIWREQEIQSDLLQKDNLERMKGDVFRQAINDDESYGAIAKRFGDGNEIKGNSIIEDLNRKELAPLDPFVNDRFGERIMRERIREKAQKGYSKYRLPTGETIGKIEGFQGDRWTRIKEYKGEKQAGELLTSQNLKIGDEVMPSTMGSDTWIITDILGDGRFKAVTKDGLQGRLEDAGIAGFDINNGNELLSEANMRIPDFLRTAETFDLTGKSNPQYRRYEAWNKFLVNKYGAKKVVDGQGNSWVEVDLTKEHAKLPVEAFGIAPLMLTGDDDN